jgi:hypothetical protein
MADQAASTAPDRVFINYRNEDEPFGAVLVDHELSVRFGEDRVFRASRSIRPGEDFAAAILSAVRRSTALLVVIGPRWLTAADDAGVRRLDQPDDWVRREIAEALRGKVRVIPLLLNTDLPRAADLPAEIAALAGCQYLRIHHRNSRYDIRRLVDELTDLLPGLAPPPAPAPPTPRWRRPRAVLVGSLAVLLALGAGYLAVTKLRHSPAAAGSAGDPAAAHSGNVLRQDELTLRAEDNADLEQGMTGTGVRVTDLYFPTWPGPAAALAIGPQGSAAIAAIPGPARFTDCAQALRARQDAYEDLQQVGTGGWLCVRTNRGNLAGVRVVRFSTAPQEVVLAVTLWRR